MEEHRRIDPGLIYHYTDAAGLKGILENLSIGASDAEFLNDSQEMRFGRETLSEALMAEAERLMGVDSESGPQYSRGVVIQSAAAHLQPGGAFLQEQAHFPFVACFCEAGDLLSQWRGYASGDGYAVGCSVAALRNAAQIETVMNVVDESGNVVEEMDGPPLDIQLVRVEYGEEAVSRMVRRVVEAVAPQPSGHPGSTGWARARDVVLPALAGVKDDAFREELEWRILVISSGGVRVRFRIGDIGMVPYIDVALPRNTVREVVIGPGRHQDARGRGVRRLLQHLGLEAVEVRPSRVPFRG